MTGSKSDRQDRSTRLVLASASARRRDLLDALRLTFDVRPADVDETPRPGEPATDLVFRLSRAKAMAVPIDGSEVIVAADTVVEVDGTILGKPADRDAAAQMLRALSGRTHRVITGVAVRAHTPGVDLLRCAVEITSVTFTTLTPTDIEWYLGTGEAQDKAGAYAVQGAAGLFVTSISGSYDNVVGLPRAALSSLLAGMGIDLRSFSA